MLADLCWVGKYLNGSASIDYLTNIDINTLQDIMESSQYIADKEQQELNKLKNN